MGTTGSLRPIDASETHVPTVLKSKRSCWTGSASRRRLASSKGWRTSPRKPPQAKPAGSMPMAKSADTNTSVTPTRRVIISQLPRSRHPETQTELYRERFRPLTEIPSALRRCHQADVDGQWARGAARAAGRTLVGDAGGEEAAHSPFMFLARASKPAGRASPAPRTRHQAGRTPSRYPASARGSAASRTHSNRDRSPREHQGPQFHHGDRTRRRAATQSRLFRPESEIEKSNDWPTWTRTTACGARAPGAPPPFLSIRSLPVAPSQRRQIIDRDLTHSAVLMR